MAEVILRLGCGLVGWLLVFAHGLLLLVIPRADCTDELFRGSLALALLAGLAAAFLLPAALAWRGYLRWCALPAAALWIPGVLLTARLLAPVTLDAVPLCDALAGTAALWQRAWPPLQLAVVAACAWRALAHWRPPPPRTAA